MSSSNEVNDKSTTVNGDRTHGNASQHSNGSAHNTTTFEDIDNLPSLIESYENHPSSQHLEQITTILLGCESLIINHPYACAEVSTACEQLLSLSLPPLPRAHVLYTRAKVAAIEEQSLHVVIGRLKEARDAYGGGEVVEEIEGMLGLAERAEDGLRARGRVAVWLQAMGEDGAGDEEGV